MSRPLRPDEIVAHGDQARQAGADRPDGAWIQEVRTLAEASLYYFLTAILDRRFLVAHLHQPLCDFLQDPSVMRKFLLAFRGGGKSTIGSRGLPLHMFVQPKHANLYFPGQWGVDTAVLLCCENLTRAKDHLYAVKSALEENATLRALWPHVVWPDPKKAPRWNNEEFILPRIANRSRADPSMRGCGINAATAGQHPDAKFEDDPIAEDAANSPVIMELAKSWHRGSRALINHPGAREYSFGTLWQVEDLWQTHHMVDPSVVTLSKALIEDGEIQWPERYVFTDAEALDWNRTHAAEILKGMMWEKISVDQLKRESGTYFPLFYLNSPADASLTDFLPSDLRHYDLRGNDILLADDPRDSLIAAQASALPARPAPAIGTPLRLRGREDERLEHRREFIRYRRG